MALPLLWFYDLQTARWLRRSGFFNAAYALATCPEMAAYRKRMWAYRLSRRPWTLLSWVGGVLSSPVFLFIRGRATVDCDPASYFSTRKYLEANPEVPATGLNPFVHYLCRGMGEARAGLGRIRLDPIRRAEVRAECQARMGVAPLTPEAWEAVRPAERMERSLAVHLHLYYPEMAEIFRDHLRNIPFRFDLYISEGPSAGPGEAFWRSGLPGLNRLERETPPNRGRDWGPLLLGFERQLFGYGAVCHVHSKKSPHLKRSGDWGGELLKALLGDPERVARILALLEGDGKLVYPAPRSGVNPDPVTGWGANYDAAVELTCSLPEVDLTQFPVTEFPQGSMFWARGEALAPLRRLPLTWESFPPEPIEPDGTIAHALERLPLILAARVPGSAYRLPPLTGS